MAVFWIGSGDPFHYDMDETPFYDAVSVLPSDVFHAVADLRRFTQTMTFGWGVEYADWLTTTSLWESASQESEQNIPLHMMLSFSIAMAFVPSVMVTAAPYFNPWTAPVAFALDAYNIYRYFD